jgi:hypothetical protein
MRRMLLYKRARAVKFRRPGGALSENQNPSPKIATSDLLRAASPSDSRARERPDFDIPTPDLELFCRAQRRTEITEFVIDLGRSFDGLSNFFAEQRAIAFA